MTVAVATRSVIDLGARTSVLDAMDRVRAVSGSEELVLAIAAGAPVLRSSVFLEVLRRAAGARRVALVTSDARARSLAASVHMPAFASIEALERHELDATEPLGPARRAAIVRAEPKRAPRGRVAAVLLILLLAVGVLGAIVAPTATIVVAPVAEALGPLEYDLRAGPNSADINATTLGPTNISTKLTGAATGSRTEETKAKGVARFTNQTTSDIRIAKGTTVRTADNIVFLTTEEKTLPKSAIIIFPPSVTFGNVDIAIEAIEPGPRGNVDARKINQSPSPGQFSVDNPAATSGGETRKIPIIMLADYDLAAS
ncbi:MAG TPA: baseplate J/gp47 family protein, partial [Candidatus Limnocylindrales bacterium]|nr:baseplate J/gp47 family protein [Candidatus Limnocylindrales bacterium]